MDCAQRGDIAENLALVRADLIAHVQPEVTSVNAQSRLTMILSLIEMLEAEIAKDGGRTEAEAAPLATAIAAATLDTVSVDARENAAAIAADDEMRLTGRTRSGQDSYAESGAGAQTGIVDEITSFDAAILERYLRRTQPAYHDAQVSGLRMLPGGFSKSTYLVDIKVQDQADQWVLRRDLPFSPLRSAVPLEFPLLASLHARGLPIAQPLWCEADPTALGAATLAVQRVRGEGDMTVWSADSARAVEIGHNAARLIAALHAIDPATLPPLETDAPGARGATPAEQLAHLRAFWHEKRIAPNPLVELVFKWLEANAPSPGASTLVHGDFGLHNVLVEGRAITALLDWEFAHIGDPREDLAYGRPFISNIMPWADFIASYVAAGGTAPDDASLDYYSVFGTFRNALGCFNVLHAVRHRLRNVDSKFAYVGRAYGNALLQDAARLAGLI